MRRVKLFSTFSHTTLAWPQARCRYVNEKSKAFNAGTSIGKAVVMGTAFAAAEALGPPRTYYRTSEYGDCGLGISSYLTSHDEWLAVIKDIKNYTALARVNMAPLVTPTIGEGSGSSKCAAVLV
jgi:hypothetical protein